MQLWSCFVIITPTQENYIYFIGKIFTDIIPTKVKYMLILLLLEATIVYIYYYCGSSEQRNKQKSSAEKISAHSFRLHVLHVWPLKAN